jgi:hypothetical protein
MATTKVSALAAKTSLAGSEELLINDSGTSKKVTATNLLAGVTVADGSISTAKIADDAVTEAKLANAINTAIAANTAKVTNATHTGDVTGATELTIASGAVETGMIADDAVTADKLANSINTEIAANTAKVTNATHTGDVTGATALTIAADAVTGAKIADDSIDSEHIVDGSIDTAHIGDDQVTADKLANSINTDIATGVTANTTANAALPKTGGTMTGTTAHGDNVKSTWGTAPDLEIYHDGSDSYIADVGTGSIYIASNEVKLLNAGANENMVVASQNGEVELYYDNTKKLETTANGVTITGTAVATTDTDATNTGSVTLDFAANQNFVLTLTGNVTLANPSTEQVGQSGFITFIQDSTGGRTVALGTDYETAGGAGLTLTSTASATDIVPYVVVAANRILLGTPQLAFA